MGVDLKRARTDDITTPMNLSKRQRQDPKETPDKTSDSGPTTRETVDKTGDHRDINIRSRNRPLT